MEESNGHREALGRDYSGAGDAADSITPAANASAIDNSIRAGTGASLSINLLSLVVQEWIKQQQNMAQQQYLIYREIRKAEIESYKANRRRSPEEALRSKSTEPIIGYRVWRAGIADSGVPDFRYRIRSTYMMHEWLPGEPMTCKDLWYDADYEKNGVHAFANFDKAVNYAVIQRAVVGEVYLWGRVVRHEFGYRAEYAYPKRFLQSFGSVDETQNAALLKALHREYGLDG